MSFFMNLIIPEGFDFYAELKKNIESNTKVEESDEEFCLVTGEKLDETAIELECGHKFNYKAIFNDMYAYRYHKERNTYSYSDHLHLREHEIRCPYCRQIQENLLPYLPDIEPTRARGVNYPPSLCMGKNTCSYVFKSGKNKGAMCGKKCYREMCNQHFKPKQECSKVELNRDTLVKMTLPELRNLAKHHNMKKYSKLKKNDLINLFIYNQWTLKNN